MRDGRARWLGTGVAFIVGLFRGVSKVMMMDVMTGGRESTRVRESRRVCDALLTNRALQGADALRLENNLD